MTSASLLGTILRHELRAALTRGRLWALGVLMGVLLVASLAAASQAYRIATAERQAVAAATRAQWDQQGDKHPHRGAHYGVYAFKPDRPLALIEPGLEPHTGQAVWLEPHRRNMMRFTPAADATAATRFADMAPGFVLSVLVPLLIIGLTYNAVSAEREHGTLRMLRGAGVPPGVLLAGKVLGYLAALVIALLPSFVIGGMVILRLGPPSPDAVARGLLLAGSYGLYYAAFVVLAIAVSARMSTSRGALFVLLALWVVFAFVVPRGAAAIAERSITLPTASAFWAGIARDYQEGLPGDGNLAARGQRFDARLLREHGVERIADLPVGVAAVRRLHRDAYANRVHAVHFAALWSDYERQQHVVSWASLLSPTLAMRSVAMHLAGTDLAHQRHFEDEAERYRQHVSTLIDEWDSKTTRGLTSFDDRYADDALWQSMPAFSYRAPGVRFALNAARNDLAVLGLWALLAVGLLALGARGLKP